MYPPKDLLICCGTSAFMAREMSEDPLGSDSMNIHLWDICYKISWINSGRPHEGAFLAKLKGVRHVVECQGYDTGAATLQGRDRCIFGDSTIKKPSEYALGKKLSSHVSQLAPRLSQGLERSRIGSKRMIQSKSNLGPRQ